MKELQKLLEAREIPFDAGDTRISCFPHVVNLATQCILKSLTNTDLAGETEDFGDDSDDDEGQGTRASDGEDSDSEDSADDDLDSNNDADTDIPRKGATTYEDACNVDPITRCRKISRTIRSTGQRRDEFDELIMKGNIKGWFKVDGETVQVPPLQLLLDVRMRWDSTFIMIKRFIELQPVRPIVVFYFILNVQVITLRLSLDFCQKMSNFSIFESLSLSGRYLAILLLS